MHDFYELSLSAGPFEIPTKELKPRIINLENDHITRILNNMIKTVMNNLKYKD